MEIPREELTKRGFKVADFEDESGKTVLLSANNVPTVLITETQSGVRFCNVDLSQIDAKIKRAESEIASLTKMRLVLSQ